MTAMLGELPTWKLEDLYSSPTGTDLDADLKIWISSAHHPLEIKVSRGADLPGIQQILAKGVLRG